MGVNCAFWYWCGIYIPSFSTGIRRWQQQSGFFSPLMGQFDSQTNVRRAIAVLFAAEPNVKLKNYLPLSIL